MEGEECRHQEESRAEMIERIIDRFQGYLYRCIAADDFRMLYVSEGIKRILGYSPEDFVTGDLYYPSIVYQDDRDLAERHYEDAIAHHRAWDYDYRVVTKGGKPIWVNEIGAAIYAPDGRVAFFEGSCTVIEGKKQAEAQREALVDAAADASEQIVSRTRAIFALLGKLKTLALNAQIEAARAGTAGKGFTIVAQEIKSLASETSQVASEIDQSTDQMRAAFEQVLTATENDHRTMYPIVTPGTR